MHIAFHIVVLLVLTCTAGIASADDVARQHLAKVVTAPTAWIAPGAGIQSEARIDQRGDWALGASMGLGGVASVGVSSDPHLRLCIECNTDGVLQPVRTTSATFRLGARENQWFNGQPALALGVRVTVSSNTYGTDETPTTIRTADIYAVASRDISSFTLHGGVIGQDAESAQTADNVRMTERLATSRWPQFRPIAALQWHPSIYPRTTLMADLSWNAERRDSWAQTWIAGWGIQFRAYPRTTLDLTVKHRQGEGLPSSTVLLGVHFGL